jgi:hypothetical protein
MPRTETQQHEGRYIAGKFSSHNKRSSLFEEYLRAQPAARRLALMHEEKLYEQNLRAKLCSVEEAFDESLGGHCETASGPRARENDLARMLGADTGGDWAWKPRRNAFFPQFQMPAFRGVPPSAAEASHAVIVEAEGIIPFQAAARAAHRAAGDYRRGALGVAS